MSQQDNFFGGFLLGTLVGGVVGGVVGVLATTKLNKQQDADEGKAPFSRLEGKSSKKKRLSANPQNMEVARRSLEDKIAQLNDAIDDVRQNLGGSNGNADASAGNPVGDRRS